jgi:hypothetical protein
MRLIPHPAVSNRLRQVFSLIVISLTSLTFAACSSGPARVNQPYISASGAGDAAMDQYDTDGDGVVAGDELENAPGLKAALLRLDTDGDKAVSADEVAERVNAWKEMHTGLASVRCHITLEGQPLAGAKVVFEPESFLGSEIKTAVGTTNQFGDAAPTIPPEERPAPNLPGGAHFGLYKVRISKSVNGRETLPARYNTETILGQEVSYDDPGMKNNNLGFALKSK